MAKFFEKAPKGAFHICQDQGKREDSDDRYRLVGLFLDQASAERQLDACAAGSDKPVVMFGMTGEVIAKRDAGSKAAGKKAA
jgi:hypothetical protein